MPHHPPASAHRPRAGTRLILFLLLVAGLLPAASGQAAPAGQTPLVVRGTSVAVPAGYAVEGQPGAQVESRVLSLPARQGSIVYLSAPVQAPFPFTDLAPSWDTPPLPAGATPDSSIVSVEVRTGPDGQTWTAWQPSDIEDIVDPRDPVTRTYGSLVGVPQDVRTHTYAQARITLSAGSGTPPPQISNLTFNFVDAGVTTQMPVALVQGGPAPAKPAVIPRTAWGSPDGERSPRWPPEYRRVTHIIIHHTETSNADGDYAARVRAIWYYHAITRGWGDIGYNYLIDPHGNVYEGRAGGDDVAAGHAYPFNYGSLGVGLIGNYDKVPPSTAMQESLIKLLDWQVDRRGINPQGVGTFTGALDCGGSVTLTRPNIAGHRDFRGYGCGQVFNDKSCPGSYVYALLPAIRAAVGTGLPPYRAIFQSGSPPASMAPGAIATVPVTVRNGGSLTWPRGGPNPVHLGYHWYTADGAPVTGGYQDLRTGLPQDVPYGAQVTLQGSLAAPTTPGTYELRWDMVHENRTWFADAGSAPLSARVVVTPQDTVPPTARVVGLPPYEDSQHFVVHWSGADAPGGSGLASYDVQVRTGAAGAWTDWQTQTTATSATFDGADGVTYAFRARARDKAGNQGAYPAQPDAVTTVAASPPALILTSPANGTRMAPGRVLVAGHTDPGALVQVNGVNSPVAVDGSFNTAVQASGQDFPIVVEASNLAGKVARVAVIVHAGGRFADVPLDYWAYNAIDYLTTAGIISGYADATFRPGGSLTRAQFVKMLAAAFRWPAPPGAPPFPDVAPDYWAAGPIAAAAGRGLVSGFGDGTFRPVDGVTRAQAVKILVLAAGWPLRQDAGSPFYDVPLTHWAYPYVDTAFRHGVLADSLGGPFRPDAPATRAEVASMLYYTLGDLAGSGRWP